MFRYLSHSHVSFWRYFVYRRGVCHESHSLARVKYFWPWVKFSRITAKQFLFCVFCLIPTRDVAASLQNMSKTFSSILNVLPKMSRFTWFSRVKLKTLGILLKYFFLTNSTSGRAHYKSVFQEGGSTP